MFRSYETGRSGFVTLVANYIPLQDPYGGPNYFTLDTAAVYEIHIDNNADAMEDITFQFRPSVLVKDLAVPVGNMLIPVPLINIGPIGRNAGDTSALNREETYTVDIIRGDRRNGVGQAVANASDGTTSFRKPVDNIGAKSIPNTRPTPTTTSTTSSSPAATTGKCSSVSARTPSSSTSARCSTDEHHQSSRC